MDLRERSPLKTGQWLALLAMVVGVIGCALVALRDVDLLWRAYLFGFTCVWLVTMGAMGLLAIGNLTGGRWAVVARPSYVTSASLVPLVAVLFVPIGMSLVSIYPWANESVRSELHLPAGKAQYLEETFFLGRAIGYFAVWLVLGWLLVWVSRFDLPPGETPAMRRVGAAALVLLVPTVTFAGFDWAMSLEPHWYSSIYGAILIAGGVLAAHALAIISLHAVSDAEIAVSLSLLDRHEPLPVESHMEPHGGVAEVRNDLGNLLLAFVMVWMYFSLSQFILIWAANLPTEIPWYLRRGMAYEGGAWTWLAVVIFLFHFVVPFLLLLSRERKRTASRLAGIAVWLLAMYAVNLYWVIVPSFSNTGWLWHAANFATLAVLGGLWIAAYSWQAGRRLRDTLSKSETQ
jgi:hypothetical protein